MNPVIVYTPPKIVRPPKFEVAEVPLCSKGLHVMDARDTACIHCADLAGCQSDLAYAANLLNDIRLTRKKWKKHPEIAMALDHLR